MTEVTIENFEEMLPIIEKCFKDATYIALDNEMSGLQSKNLASDSLFDTPAERYANIKDNIDPFIVMQIGLTAFRHLRDENTFLADSFTFYLMPRMTPLHNRQFLWQVSSIEFLTQHGFDFNKFAYSSISYLNEEEEEDLKKEVYRGTFLQSTGDYIPLEIAGDIEKQINQIYEWLNKKEIKPYEILELNAPTPLVEYLLHKRIRSQFNNIWTKVGTKMVFVLKVKPDEKQKFKEDEPPNTVEDRLINYYIGFSKVFKLFVNSKKPIVGHNIFTDLLFMYKQFYRPLPKNYNKFKEDIHRMFPVIYDTKSISFSLGNLLKREDRWKMNGLGEMYTYFKEDKGRYLAMNSPVIKKNQSFQFSDGSLRVHDAGSDSYYAGYIFVKMAHVFAVKKFGSGTELKPLTCREIMASVKQFENQVNVIRALVSHVSFGGPDPASKRPYWLLAQLLSTKMNNVSQIAEMLSPFGNVNVKEISPRRALIAVGNHTNARDILNHFKTHKELRIVPYNPLLHSNGAWYTLWTGAIVTGSLLVWYLRGNISKS